MSTKWNEKMLEKELTRRVELLGGVSVKLVTQNKNGIPDRLLVIPGGRCIFVELKSPGEKLRPLQKYWRGRLKELKHNHWVIDSKGSLDRFTREELSIYGVHTT